MSRRILATALSLLWTVLVSRELAQGELEEVLRQAEKSQQEYVGTFRDLTAVETWVTEILKKNGTIDSQRTVVSDFYVYPSKFTDVVSEYRITREVNGKAAVNPTDEAMKLFRALARARTVEQEDRALREQNFRHVLRFIVFGLTVHPFWAVRRDVRQEFAFAVAGRERVGEQDFVVLTYESKAFRLVEPATIFKHFKDPRRGFRGRIWLDAKERRIRRWVDDLMVLDDQMTTPAVLMHKEIDYVLSGLGVLPTRIAISLFDKSDDKKSPHSLRPTIRQAFTYKAFKRFDVTTATEIRTPAQK